MQCNCAEGLHFSAFHYYNSHVLYTLAIIKCKPSVQLHCMIGLNKDLENWVLHYFKTSMAVTCILSLPDFQQRGLYFEGNVTDGDLTSSSILHIIVACTVRSSQIALSSFQRSGVYSILIPSFHHN